MVLWKTLFHAFSRCSNFIPPEIIQVTFGFLMFSGSIKGYIGKKQVKLFNSFQPNVPLLYPLWRSSIVSREYKIGTLRRNGWNYKLFMLLFTQFKNSFFQGATFINCFRIFKWIVRESLLHKVHGVHKQTGIGVQVNNLQIHGVEITLNVVSMRRRWNSVELLFLPSVCRLFFWKRTRKTFRIRWKGEIWVKLQNLF